MNLLDHFVLQHLQLGVLHAELFRAIPEKGAREAKLELNLAPRLVQTESHGQLPIYRVSARLVCTGGTEKDKDPLFTARVGFEAIYRQIDGEPVDLAQFTASHASLTRQLYPLLQNELRLLLARLGLEHINLPFDLAARAGKEEGHTIQVSSAVH